MTRILSDSDLGVGVRVRQVGFIDFGIVGRVSPVTWAAVGGLADGLAAGDYRRMAAALVRRRGAEIARRSSPLRPRVRETTTAGAGSTGEAAQRR